MREREANESAADVTRRAHPIQGCTGYNMSIEFQ